jgi:hypothetical protein
MSEETCAIIVQAVACIAAKILHEEESYVSSRAGKITGGHKIGDQLMMFIDVLVPPIFNAHIACCMNHSGGFIQNWLQELITPDWHCTVMCQRGGRRGVNLSCCPYKMAELQQVFVLHVPFDTLPGVRYMISWGHVVSCTQIFWRVCGMLLRWQIITHSFE